MNRSVMKIWSKTGVRVAFATVGDDLGVQSIEPIFLMPADGQGVDAWQSEHVPALSALLPCRSPRPACAHGKVCLLDVTSGCVSSLQASVRLADHTIWMTKLGERNIFAVTLQLLDFPSPSSAQALTSEFGRERGGARLKNRIMI